jgi:predicted dehydrogenase
MSDLTRRTFLHGAGAVALSSPLRIKQDEKPVGFAILGLGGYAQGQILPNMKHCKLAKPVAVISGSPDKAKRVAAQYGIADSMIFNYENLEKIKDHPEIDVVYVITPPGTHKDFTIRALRSGKHVCCEKPMAMTTAEGQAMVDEAKKAGKILQIGYRCHYEPYNLRAMEICRKAEIGKVRSIATEHGYNAGGGGWMTDGKMTRGALWEIGVYSVNAACYLAGGAPTEVMALSAKLPGDQRYSTVEDLNHFVLAFPNGVLANVGSGFSWAYVNNYRVVGEHSVLDANPATGYSGHNFRINGQPIKVEPANMWALQMDDLAECIRRGGKVRTPGEMGVLDLKIMEGAIESAREKKVISLV